MLVLFRNLIPSTRSTQQLNKRNGIKQKMITTLKIYIISLSFESLNVNIKIELSCEKNSVMVSAYCIDPDQPAQSAHANPALHIPSQVDRGIE